MAALNPLGQQLPLETHLLLPDVMSFTKEYPSLYSVGLIQPTDPLPMASLAALILEMKPATAGHEADVPDTR
jgi:hypothetical protein